MTLHAHIETRTRDCDGVIEWTHVMTMTEAERDGEFGDIEFHKRVVAATVNTYSLDSTGMLTVTRLEDGDVRASWHEHTEEGFRAVQATLCTDPCDLGEPDTYRDRTAEAAGY